MTWFQMSYIDKTDPVSGIYKHRRMLLDTPRHVMGVIFRIVLSTLVNQFYDLHSIDSCANTDGYFSN